MDASSWTLQNFPLSALEPATLAESRDQDAHEVNTLARSIAHEGLTTPLIGYRCGDKVVVVDGRRRLKALRQMTSTAESSEPETNRKVSVWIADRDTSERAAARANLCRRDRSAVARALDIKRAYAVPDATGCGPPATADESRSDSAAGDAFQREAVLACLMSQLAVSGETARRFFNHAQLPESTLHRHRDGSFDSSTKLDELVKGGEATPASACGDAASRTAVQARDVTGASTASSNQEDDPRDYEPASPQVVAFLNEMADPDVRDFFTRLTAGAEPHVIRIGFRHFRDAYHKIGLNREDTGPRQTTGPTSSRTGGTPSGPAVDAKRAADVVGRLTKAKAGLTYRELEHATGIAKATACKLINGERQPDPHTVRRIEQRIDASGRLFTSAQQKKEADGVATVPAGPLVST
jgi:predicted transcriptional regulator